METISDFECCTKSNCINQLSEEIRTYASELIERGLYHPIPVRILRSNPAGIEFEIKPDMPMVLVSYIYGLNYPGQSIQSKAALCRMTISLSTSPEEISNLIGTCLVNVATAYINWAELNGYDYV